MFLFVQSTHHFTVHGHKQTGGILLGERKQQNFLRLRRKQEGLWPSIAQPEGTKPREIRTLGVRRKVEQRLQRADRQQTKKTKKKTKETKDAKKKRCAVHHLSL